MKKQYILGGVLYNTAKAFGANETIANSLGMVGGGAEMFINPMSGGIDAARYGAGLIQTREFGGLTHFEGNDHDNGGITINPSVEVEGGETMNQQFVFSDSVKPKGSKYTYAELSKKIEAKYKNRPDNDKLSKESIQLELDALKLQHESDPQIISARDKEERKQFKLGGPIKDLQYNPDDYTGNNPQLITSPVESGWNTDFQKVYANPQGYIQNNDGSYSPIPESLMTPQVQLIQPRSGSFNQSTPTIQPNTNITPNVNPNNKKYMDIAQGETSIPITGALLNSVGPTAQLAGTLIQGVDDVNFNRMGANYVDYDPAISLVERQAGNARATNRFNTVNNATSSGQLLSNIVSGNTAINANASEQIAKLKQDELNTNTQIKNNVNQMNTGIANEEEIARQQNKAAYRQAIYGALTDLGNIGAGYTRDNAMMNAQNLQNERALQMLNSLPYRYGWQMT